MDLVVIFTLFLFLLCRFTVPYNFIKVFVLLFFLFVATLIVGVRPLDAGFDTHHYVYGFNLVKDTGTFFNVSTIIKEQVGIGSEYFFWLVGFFVSFFGGDANSFLWFSAFFSLCILYCGLRKIFPETALLYLFAFVVCGTFYNTFGNAMRQAYVLSLLPFLIYYRFLVPNFFFSIFTIFVMFFFHKGGGVICLAFYIVSFIGYRNLLILYILSFPLSVFVEKVVSMFISHDIYIKSSAVYFHPAFLLLNLSFWGVVSLRRFGFSRFSTLKGQSILKTYLIFLSFSIIFSFNVFAFNRVANFAYLMQAIILCYAVLGIREFRNIIAFFFALLCLLWGCVVLSSDSVGTILYG
ncbi:EpsG family protein [Motilimonas cestriensis]|uniref:EpsG family protein n=1 Tax=Motilimonas cestriensis TaxID=2742685 RepID=UPI003DA326FE